MRDHDCKAPAVKAAHIGGYLRARLLFQLDPSTPARPRPVACLFMIAKRSNVLSCRIQRV
jgi:hypothetical protein